MSKLARDTETAGSETIGVVARAALVLRTLAENPNGLSLAEIANTIDLARSTVQRLVSDLEREQFVSIGARRGQIRLGPEFIRLAQLTHPSIIERIRPFMTRLTLECGETVDFSIVHGRELLFLEQILGRERIQAVSRVGDRFPLHSCSVGKSYLGQFSNDQVARIIGKKYEALTPNTATTFGDLAERLQDARKSGIGSDDEENSLGIVALGFAFEDRPGEWFGISVPMPVDRAAAKRSLVESRLIEIKKSLEEQKGSEPAIRAD